jgi:DNA recombination-dependent growth factor C
LATGFEKESFDFGGFYAFQARLDQRKLSAKILNRYALIEETKIVAETGHRLNAQAKKELKENLKAQLLRRALLDTDLFEVLWRKKEAEIWIGGAGEKKRLNFEYLFEQTFELGVRLLAPITIGLEVIPEELGQALLDSTPTSFVFG